MTFVLIFLLPRDSFLYLSLYLYKICRSARSTRVDRSRSGRSANFFLLSSTLSFFFFGTIFEMHSQLSSANLFALAFAELQDHAGSPGGARLPLLPSVVKASSYYARVLLIISFSLTCFISFFGGFFLYLFWFCSHVVFVSLA